MNAPEKPPWDGHPEADLLLFVEDLLEVEQRNAVVDHLAECRACTDEVESLRRGIGILNVHKEAFCPEPWDILELVRSGRDPDGACAAHIEKCPICREEAETLRADASESEVPETIWKTFLETFPLEQAAAARREVAVEESGIVRRAWDWLSRPLLTVAAVAAAAAVVILVLYQQEPALVERPTLVKKPSPISEQPPVKEAPPVQEPTVAQEPTRGSEPAVAQETPRAEEPKVARETTPIPTPTVAKEPVLVVGLSSVEWTPSGSPKDHRRKGPPFTMMSPTVPQAEPLAPAPKPKVAIVLLLKGLEGDFAQSTVDKLYQSLSPSDRTTERFEVLPPSAVKEAAGQDSLTPAAKPEILSRLSTGAGASQIVLVTVVSHNGSYAIEGERCEGSTGETVKSSCSDPVEEPELEARLRGVADDLLKNGEG